MNLFGAVLRVDGSPLERADVERMAAACGRGAPEGVWLDGTAGLVVAADPHAHGSGLAISADCRIDNREELGDGLGIDRAGLASTTDAELILHAYAKWGLACCDHLLGDFSFAIRDTRARRLFCARDPIGVKPFYLYRSPGLLAVSSRVSAIRALPGVAVTLNEARVADIFVSELEAFDHVSTFFREIERLPPATWLLLEDGEMRARKYWSPPDDERRVTDSGELDEEFRSVLRDAVRCRLDRDGASAVMLSGGLDSSAIVAAAREGAVRPVRTCSVISADPGCVETEHIRLVASVGSVNPRFVSADDVSILGTSLEAIVLAGEEPFDAFMALPQLVYATEAGKSSGVLDGVDGDLAVSLLNSPVPRLLRTGQWPSAVRQTLESSGGRKIAAARRLAGEALRAAGLGRSPAHEEVETLAFVDPAFARRHRLLERAHVVEDRLRADPRRSVAWNQWRVLADPFVASGLERYARLAGAFGIEPRHPFFDLRVLEFCASLPWDLRVRGRWQKFLLRRSFSGLLPKGVAWREPRVHLGLDVYKALLARFRAEIADRLAANGGVGEIVDLKSVRDLFQRMGDADGRGVRILWTVLVCSIWMDRGRLGR